MSVFNTMKRLTRDVRAGVPTRLKRATVERLIKSRLLSYQRFTGIAPSRDDDTFIVSFPRSGNTLIRFLIANMLSPDEPITLDNVDEFIPVLPNRAHTASGVRQGDWPRMFKTHDPYFHCFPKSIYIVRDGRDSLVSYFHRQTQQGLFKGSFSDYLAQDGHTVTDSTSWADHVAQALAHQARHPARVLLIRYEDMIADLRGTASRINAFCGLNVSEAAIARAVDACAFQNLQKGEALVANSAKPTMFRRGQAGAWVDTFSPAEAQAFWDRHGDLLKALGYREHATLG